MGYLAASLLTTQSVSLRSLLSTVTMGRSKPNTYDRWTSEEQKYCLEQYYEMLNYNIKWYKRESVDLDDVKRAYWREFHERNSTYYGNREKCPTSDHIMAWVKIHEEKQKPSPGWKQTQDHQQQQQTPTSKLSGTQWGRKTGENRIIRTESVDMGQQHQAIKWKQRDTKWSGPRPHNEKRDIKVPVVEGNPFWWYRDFSPSVDEEVKPDKKQVLKEKFEGEVLELIESLDAHGHAARTSAFDSLRAALQRRAVDGLLAAHRATLADHVTRALRRGKDRERMAAAAAAPVVAVQIGEEVIEEFVREVRPALTATATDKTASLDTRTRCCSSLAVLTYLVEEDLTEILEVMRMYEIIFSGSYLKDDGSMKVSGAAVEEGTWHAAALDGWALLLPLLSPDHALSLLNNQAPSFAKLGELLGAVSLEVRMAAGVALAIAYETVAGDDSNNPLTSHVEELLPRLSDLARDSNKTRARKDRRIQRATFREILKYFEDGEAPSTSAHIGTETAAWSSWSGGAAYAALAGALGGALQVLAPRCGRLRAALQMSTEAQEEEKPKKLQRHRQNKATNKARHFSRSKNRHKCSAALDI